MATPQRFVVQEAGQVAMNALNAAQGYITDAQINPLTTTAQLIALFQRAGAGPANWNQVGDVMFHKRSIEYAVMCGLLTDANIAAANTMAGLRTAINVLIPTPIATTFQSGRRAWV